MNAPVKRLTGRIAPERIRMMTVPRPPAGVVERFRALGDPSGVISDAMDELGIPPGVIGASILRPTIPGAVIVGPATTVRNILQRVNPLDGAKSDANKMAEFEAHNLATPGDVLVIQGVANVSEHGRHLGADRQAPGRGGAIAWAARDIAHLRARSAIRCGRDITPTTGKWRIETVEINGDVQLGEVRVRPAILVVADDTGVLHPARAHPRGAGGGGRSRSRGALQAIDGGIAVPDISRASYGEK